VISTPKEISTMRVRSPLGTAAAVLGAILLAAVIGLAPAYGMGGSDQEDDDSPGTTTGGTATAKPKKTCPSGWTYDAATDKCQQDQGALDTELPAVGWGGADPAFLEAAVLAHSGRHEAAIAALEALGRHDDPYVLNYLGYSNRKLGRIEPALAFYARALALRPDYVRVREYLGEGYLELGRLDDARDQLAAIGRQCGTACDPYLKLDAAIQAHLKGQDI
jgi:tetratricopeptide (TPR) repeat protein